MPNPVRPAPVRLLAAVPMLAAVAVLTGCAGPESQGDTSSAIAYEGARAIVGDGSAPIEDAVLVVDGGLLTAVGPRSAVEVPGGAAPLRSGRGPQAMTDKLGTTVD